MVTGDAHNITYSSNSILSSAGYIDDVATGEPSRYEEEIAAQLRDMETLATDFGPVDLAALRTQAQTIGRRHSAALKTAFR